MSTRRGFRERSAWEAELEFCYVVHKCAFQLQHVACVHDEFRAQEGKGGVETESLRLRVTKTAPVFEDGEWETNAAPYASVAETK